MAGNHSTYSIRRLVFPTLVAIATSWMLWFICAFLAPKVEASLLATPYSGEVPDDLLGRLIGYQSPPPSIVWPFAGVLTVLLTLVIVPRSPSRLRQLAAAAFQAVTLLVLGMTFCVSVSIFLRAHMAYAGAASLLHFCRTTVEQLSLKEVVEGRFDRLAMNFHAWSGAPPRVISKEQDLPPDQRAIRLLGFQRELEMNNDPAFQRRILATSAMFRETLRRHRVRAEGLLPFANRLAGEAFSNYATFLDWLSHTPNPEEWEPIPIYRFDTQK